VVERADASVRFEGGSLNEAAEQAVLATSQHRTRSTSRGNASKKADRNESRHQRSQFHHEAARRTRP
jgi:hypothetical protein